MPTSRASTRRAAPAAFLLFAAVLFVVGPAEASRTKDGRSGLAQTSAEALLPPSLELASLELSMHGPVEPSRFGSAEDLGLLDPEARACGFELFGGVGTRRCFLTYARNNPLKYVDPDGKAYRVPEALNTAASVAVGFHPVAGTVQDVGIALTGYDWVTSQRVGGRDRWIAAAAIALPVVGGVFISKLLGKADDAVRLADDLVVVRGGTKDVPAAGEVFSGAVGRTVEEAASGVPHGQIRTTTVGEVKRTGGAVVSKPEPTRSGAMNEKHVDVCLGEGPCPFGPLVKNPVPPGERVK